MSGMGLVDYVRAVRRSWVAVGLCVALGIAIAATTVLLATPKYAAETTIALTYPEVPDKAEGKKTGKPGSVDQALLLSYKRLKLYAKSAESKTITGPALDTLRLKMNPEQAARLVDARVDNNSSILRIIVTHSDAAFATKLSGAVTVHLAAYIETLERPPNGGPSPVKATVTGPPSTSSTPISPQPLNALGLGLLLGLAGGIMGAIIREGLDRSITSVEALADLTGAPTLGTIGYDQDLAANPLAPQLDPRAPSNIAFQQLRTSLQFVDRGQHPKRLLITSAGTSEGKTTTAANLAVTLARTGRRVVLLECDIHRQKLAGLFGLSHRAGLTTVLSGRIDPEDALQPVDRLPLELLVAGPEIPNAGELVRSRTMELLLRELDRRADLIVIDAPALLAGDEGAVLAHGCDGAILLVRHGRTTRPQVEKALETMARADARVLGTVLTMVPSASAPQTPAPADASAAAERTVGERSGGQRDGQPESRPLVRVDDRMERRPGPRVDPLGEAPMGPRNAPPVTDASAASAGGGRRRGKPQPENDRPAPSSHRGSHRGTNR